MLCGLAVMLWPPCVRCPRSFWERGPATSMALRRLALFKKSARATRDYSSPPIGFPDSQRMKSLPIFQKNGS